MAESAWYRGEGGGLFQFDLPLPSVYAEQERQGRIARVNADGTLWSAEVEPKPRPKPVDVDGEDADLGPVRPSQASPKAQWVDYAQLVSDLSRDEAQALTKAELVDRFGS